MTILYLLGGFLTAALLGALIIPNILLISYKKRLFDVPDKRKVHSIPVPRLGGLSFFPVILISVGLTVGTYFFLSAPAGGVEGGALCEFLFLTVGAMLLFLVGVADDLVGVGYRYKFAVQVLAAVLMVLPGEWLNSMGGLAGLHALPAWAGVPFTVFIVVFITNAINLIDGIDGLASGLCSVACLFYGLTFFMLHQHVYAILAFATLGVLVPFFYYNVFGNAEHGRKIFMGDTGSLTVGMMLCFLSLKLTMCGLDDNTGNVHPMVLAFSPLLVPCCDVVRVYLHRVRNGKNPFLPDKNHIHHKLLALGIKQRNAMIIIVSVSTIFILLNILLSLYLNVNWIVLGDILIWTLANIRLTKSIGQLQSEQKTNK